MSNEDKLLYPKSKNLYYFEFYSGTADDKNDIIRTKMSWLQN